MSDLRVGWSRTGIQEGSRTQERPVKHTRKEGTGLFTTHKLVFDSFLNEKVDIEEATVMDSSSVNGIVEN
eukprot:scaffold10009_cov105-Cylindrotheca_fusiformis.AAC.7